MWVCFFLSDFLVWFELLKKGFSNIDALEPNGTMLDLARKRGLYKNYYLEYITADPCSLAEGEQPY